MIPTALMPSHQRRMVVELEALERAKFKLLTVTPLSLYPLVDDEVDRREDVFARQLRTSTSTRDFPTPRRAAVESVYEDVISGRLR